MDYEKKYKDALERAKEELGSGCFNRGSIEYIFPELKESEDEKIRNSLLRWVQSNSYTSIAGIQINDVIAWLEKQSKPEDMGEVSDGYHTFNELYYYRMLYNAAFFNRLPKDWVHKSKRHHEGEECFGGGWFIVMANLPTGQISNHYELKDWDLFQIPEKDIADEWDGHTPQQAAERLHKFLLEKQGEQKPVDKIQLGKKYKCIASPRYSTFMIGQIYEPKDKFLCSLMNFCYDCFEPIEDDEQKPADKIKPKFKVGDWIVNDYCTGKVIALTEDAYLLDSGQGIPFSCEHNAHLWSIEDAKDGDVLATDSWLYIFKYTNNKNLIQFHCSCPIDGKPHKWYFSPDESYLSIYIDANIHPATKEQRDILFQKMEEVGYKWDAKS